MKLLLGFFLLFGVLVQDIDLTPLANLNDIKENAEEHLLAEMNDDWRWDHERTPFAVSALALSNDKIFTCGNITGSLIKKSLQLELAGLLLRRNTNNVSSGKLALYVNAFKATCQDPHDFFNFNLVSMMRHKQATNGYELALKSLALCNAGHRLSKEALSNLTSLFKPMPKSVHNGLDTQAMAALAIACFNRHHQGTYTHNILKDAISLFKHFQKGDGSFGNIYTTALVTQVFIAAGEHQGKEIVHFQKALSHLKTYYEKESDKQSVMSHYFVLPILNLKSLAHLKHLVCSCRKNIEDTEEKNEDARNDVWSIVDSDYNDIQVLSTDDSYDSDVVPRVSVTYTVWEQQEKDHLPANNISTVVFINEGETFLDVMEKAYSSDDRFRYLTQNTTYGPFVHSLSGLNNNASLGTYWLLYKLENDNKLRIMDKGILDIKPKDGDNFLFIYHKLS